ncbi:helix-turn-helix domain-containing protein [Micromonospora sp. NPDC047557]|uniref:helix-turn-helix domain-containing protein n=1 Tax=Micromonospora sp. NPDC047557 TaxID=3364250 RepID=UPI0037130C7A
MTVSDSASMGRRIAEARSRAGLTQADLASAISLDRSVLAKIENGGRRVSALELARIANTLGERIEWFVMETPPAIVSHRNLEEPGAESPTIDRTVERVTWNVEFTSQRDERWNTPSVQTLSRPRNAEEAEASSTIARGLLGLNSIAPLVDIAGHFSNLGLLVFAFDLGRDAADAASVLLERGGVAVVNGHLHVGRRRLAAAHELGHFLFADEYSVDWRVSDWEDDNAWESRLDRFARALLLPAVGLRQMWDDSQARGDDLRARCVKIGSIFRVDMSTLARRLIELGLIAQSGGRQVRSIRTTRADIVELNLVVPDELAPPCLPRSYEESVLRIYRHEMISPARATDLLFDTWNEEDLPVLPSLPESAIWNLV